MVRRTSEHEQTFISEYILKTYSSNSNLLSPDCNSTTGNNHRLHLSRRLGEENMKMEGEHHHITLRITLRSSQIPNICT
jgi:hypothetical protein